MNTPQDGHLSVDYRTGGVDLTIKTTSAPEASLTVRLDLHAAALLATGLSAWAAGQGVDR